MEKIIGYFNYNNEKYQIRFIDTQNIGIFKESHNSLKIATNLNKEIIAIIKNLLSVHPNDSFLYATRNLGNHNYNIYFDKISSLYFWDSSMNDESINTTLNFKYNHTPFIMYNDTNHHVEKNDFFTKLIRVKNKIIPIFLSATLTISMLAGCTVLSPEEVNASEIEISEGITILEETELESLESDIIYEEAEEEYSFEQIKIIIERNPNLSQEEKDLLYKLQFVFDEYHEYMDLPVIKDRLNTLRTEYEKEVSIDFMSGKTLGSYSIKDNIMKFNFENFEETGLPTFLHEFFHVLQVEESIPFTLELSNEFFTREVLLRLYKEGILPKRAFLDYYFKNYYDSGVYYNDKEFAIESEEEWLRYITLCGGFGNGYNGYEVLYKILAELVPKEALLEYQFNPSKTFILVEALINLEGRNDTESLKRANALINKINDLREYSSEKQDYIFYSDGKECFELLNYYYELKYGHKIESNLEMILNILECDIRTLNLGINGSSAWNFFRDIYGIDFGYTVKYLTGKTILSNAQTENVIICVTDNRIASFQLSEDLDSQYKEYLSNTPSLK